MPRRVLITGARAAAALDLARDFRAAGWEPHVADSVPARMAKWSRAPAAFHSYPRPLQDSRRFRRRIVELVERHDFELVVPTCEEVFHLAAPGLHTRLGERLFAPGMDRLRSLHDKFAFAKSCALWGLPTPESHLVADESELWRFVETSANWVFKPRFSRFGDGTLVAPPKHALMAIEFGPNASWVAQRYVAGTEVCFHAVAHSGKLRAFAAYQSEWRLGGGARYAFDPLDERRSGVLQELAETLAEKAEIHGQFACDVMFDEADSPWLLECNPRATSGVHLLAGNGDLARAIADGVAAGTATRSQPPRYLAPAMIVFGLPRALRMARFRHWLACMRQGHDVILTRGDRMPLVGAIVDAAGFTLHGIWHNISTNAATTHDIEWNGEELT